MRAMGAKDFFDRLKSLDIPSRNLFDLLLQVREQLRVEEILNRNTKSIAQFLTVEIVVLLLHLLMILLIVDCVMPLFMLRALMEISCFSHNSIILRRTASPMVM